MCFLPGARERSQYTRNEALLFEQFYKLFQELITEWGGGFLQDTWDGTGKSVEEHRVRSLLISTGTSLGFFQCHH